MRHVLSIGVVLAGGLAVAGPGAAAGTDPVPPKVELRAGGEHQRGGVAWEEWTRPAGPGYCVGSSGDGTGEFPQRPLEVSGPGHARFVFATRRRPRVVRITAWRLVDGDGRPVGEGEDIESVLTPRLNDGGEVRAWRARFAVAPPPDYYFDLYARWRPGSCGGPNHMLRTFHLGLKGAGG